MKKLHLVFLVILATLAFSSLGMAQYNPCNPCGGKEMMQEAGKAMNPCNPCGMKGHHFHVNDPMGRNSITFTSTAPLEDIVGTSTQISGYVVFDPENPTKSGRGELSVPVASINTGIPLRDEHLRSEDWMNASQHPNIVLTITDTRNVRLVKKTGQYQTYDLTITGKMMINGKSRSVEIPGRLTYMSENDQTRQSMPGDLLAVRADFNLTLADYGITGPGGRGIIGSKVGETIGLAVSFRATNAASAALAGSPTNPCGGKAMNPCNPCGPATGKAMNPCNPCGPDEGKATPPENPCNPCG